MISALPGCRSRKFRVISSIIMLRPLHFLLLLVALYSLTACSTVSDLVVTNIPDHHHGRPKIVIKLREQRAILFRGKVEVAESRVSTGREGYRTPVGSFRVIRKDEDHRSGIYGSYLDRHGRVIKGNVDLRNSAKPPHTHFEGASMPFFLEFSPGFGLHAGYLPGYPASHGCVRMPFWKARQFFRAARVGTTVIVEK